MSRTSRLLGAVVVAAGAVAALPASPALAANAWTASVPVSAATGSTSYPALVTGAGGTATAVWIQTTGSATEVDVAQRAANGTWTAPRRLSDPAWKIPSSRDFAPQLAVEPNGAIDVVWAERSADGVTTRIRLSRFTAPAGWGAATTVVGEGRSPSVAADSVGRVAVAWNTDAGVRSRVRNENQSWGGTTTLFSAFRDVTYPEPDEPEQYEYVARTTKGVRLISCRGQVTALATAYRSSGYSNPNSGFDDTGPTRVVAKDLTSSNGTWPQGDASVQEPDIASDAGTGAATCSPTGDLTIATIGDYASHNRFSSFYDIEFRASTRPTGSTAWSTPEHFAGTTSESSDPAPDLPRVFSFAYAADGGLLRATELNRQVSLVVRPKGGSFGVAAPLLPAAQPTTNPFVYVAPNGVQTLLSVRDGDVASHAEVRQRASSGAAWGAPVTLSTAGLPVGNVLTAGNADGTQTALVLQKSGANWRLVSSAFVPTPAPTRVPAKLSGATVAFDLDLAQTASACPAASALWVSAKNAGGNLTVKSRALTIKAGAGSTCTVTGTATLTAAPSRSGLTVSIGGTGLTYRTVVPS